MSKATTNSIKKIAEFVKEPYAWLIGQAFKYILKPNTNFENLLMKTIENLNINFNHPIVGYLKLKLECYNFIFLKQ